VVDQPRPEGRARRVVPINVSSITITKGEDLRNTQVQVGAGVAALIGTLIAIYSISQFLRNSVGVIAHDLARELDLSATELGLLSSAFFLAFAAVQIPVGIAIDRYGGKRTLIGSALLCIVGTLLFAAAPSGALLIAARALMGLGCSSFFMAPLAIYARRFPPERFAFLTSVHLGIGSIGTLVATAPLASAAASVGWRAAFAAVAALTALAAAAVMVAVPSAEAPQGARESWREAFAGVARAMRVPSFWPVFLAHATAYASFATIIGLWAGPWLTDVHGVGLEARGRLLLIGATAQIFGLFAWGFADRYFRSYRRAVLIAASLGVALLLFAALVPLSPTGAAVWLGLYGFAVAYSPIITAHGKSLFPAALTGRGITLMNMGTMGGVFLLQTGTGALVDLVGGGAGGTYGEEAYRAVFLVLGLAIAASLIPYMQASDPHPSETHESSAKM
jgi:predicted MFS family arabinose efflux permease